MDRSHAGLICVGILLLLSTTAATAGNKHSVAENQMVVFNTPIRIGGTLIDAGSYDVRHLMRGKEHIMVFSLQSSHEEVIRARCTLVPVNFRITQTEIGVVRDPAGQLELVRMQFKGDRALHMIQGGE